MDTVEVPSYFLCPISLDIMRDPVIISTGITYERASIEKWVFLGKNHHCPVTKQSLCTFDLTPNHNLRRLIQDWCTINSSDGIQRFPTPKAAVDSAQIAKLIAGGKRLSSRLECLRILKSIAGESEANKRIMQSSGVIEFLNPMINSTALEGDESRLALSILHTLALPETILKTVMGNEELVESLTGVLSRSDQESKTYAILLLKAIFVAAGTPAQDLINMRSGNLVVQVVRMLNDQVSNQASKAAMKVLFLLSPSGRNRIKAVEAGAIPILVDTLIDSTDKKLCEATIMVLERLCSCAEGRSEFLKHGAGLAIVSKKILRVSPVASERAVRIIHSVAKSYATPSVVQEMLQVGVVAKLCLLLHVECGSKTTEKAREILSMHAKVWRASPCAPSNFLP